MNQLLLHRVNQVQLGALIAGLLGLGACAFAAMHSTRQFFASYLFGYLFWLGLGLGCLGVVMLHHLTGGRWGYPVRRFLEAGSGTLPLMALLFIPLLFGLHDLYPWARPDSIAHDQVLQQKRHYMNAPGFILRTAVIFFIWLLIAHFLKKWSAQQDQTENAGPARRLRKLSGPGIVIYPVTATFAYIDWVMSLEADWYSTIFPVIVLIGQFLITIAFAILLLAIFRNQEPFAKILAPFHLHHLGNLMLAFVMFWTYVAFSQLLIIWSGNLPHEISWYLHRSSGGWKWIIVALALFHFFIPFFLLLFRSNKRRIEPLVALAIMVLLAHLVNVFWLIAPTFQPHGIRVSWMDITAPIGVGGIWLAVFLWRLKGMPLIPLHDPGHQFSNLHEH